ncbi:mannitol dehydrogenase [Burkholderia pseudomallei]|nr:mannitol dehydrogenase Rossmann domain protein [Burkholderia pseudomallei NAU20B-16]AHG37866.1 mannitol dehydrogenase Rossmann domain protein [Burkholderia pseudomallei MSHR511]AHG71682.1 mannitol dehydrogenase Rossmann domain protein [Burkholderia pseudomallei MSHR146]AIO53756.1 mannitol dehydrogenase Rossmann domain protein [Burkholderia mallei]AIO98974.1 mannitol dehydrogenase Rossmann domain protein [Burkholderia pseudomallei 576]AIP68401.1 mannitol dehydrogenase Rossmann domain protein
MVQTGRFLVMPLLSSDHCRALPPEVSRPRYDRRALRTGIVHLGLGAFHRAHQACYTETLVERGDLRWGIAGVELRRRHTVERLAAQDHLYSVTERAGDAARTRVVGAVHRTLFAPQALATLLGLIADPSVSIVSLTVTEKGYYRRPGGGGLDLDDPAIRRDLAQPHAPSTTLGVLAAGIRLRAAHAPLSVLSCDNMPSNGDTLRALLAQYAEQTDGALARRIRCDVAFPNTMVDRIVPAATPESLDWVQSRIGVRDEAAIVCEPFAQWVFEDRFAGARPRWEDAGALVAADVRPYEKMKLRLLNGSHSAIAYAGQLRGRRTVSDAMADPLIDALARGVMTRELLATLDVPAGYDVRAYCASLIERFRNPALAHRTAQIATDGTQKVPLRWLPALAESAAAGVERPFLERSLAMWLHYVEVARDESGRPLVLEDPGAQALAARLHGAPGATDAVRAALGLIASRDAARWPEALTARVGAHLETVRTRGTDALLRPLLDA